MQKITIILALVAMAGLTGCEDMLPGMQNIDTSHMPHARVQQHIQVAPIVIPVTADTVRSQRHTPFIYRVASQDILNIIVWQHPEFTPGSVVQTAGATQLFGQPTVIATPTSLAAGQQGYLVNEAGKIYFPLIGYVPVAGKTVDNIRQILQIRLRKYVTNPQVMVRVADFRSKKAYVFGEVKKPGVVPLTDQPISITDALTLTESFDLTTADPTHIYVIRGNLAHPEIYWLNAKTPDKLLLAEYFRLQPYDIMYVSSAPVTRWNRFLNQILPTLQTIWYTEAITHPN